MKLYFPNTAIADQPGNLAWACNLAPSESGAMFYRLTLRTRAVTNKNFEFDKQDVNEPLAPVRLRVNESAIVLLFECSILLARNSYTWQ